MGRLTDLQWDKVSSALQYDIYGCPLGAHRDLIKMWANLEDIATEISKLEVVERRTMGSSGRRVNEKFEELLNGINNLEQMILLAHLSCG